MFAMRGLRNAQKLSCRCGFWFQHRSLQVAYRAEMTDAHSDTAVLFDVQVSRQPVQIGEVHIQQWGRSLVIAAGFLQRRVAPRECVCRRYATSD
jgi:hypothetical protein